MPKDTLSFLGITYERGLALRQLLTTATCRNPTFPFLKMPKPRNTENRGLPSRWRCKHGAYYFPVPEDSRGFWDGRTEFRLGTTLLICTLD
jgi:hypothetical protein